MSSPSISVVIPVKNEARNIRDCIEGILNQTVPVKEIIVIDSGSTDGTVDILTGYKEVTIIEIPSVEFNHGRTRNLGISKCSGDLILFTVGDAKPLDNTLIETLLSGFIDDEVIAVCGQQVVPHEVDKNPVQWFRPISEAQLQRFQIKGPDEFNALSPAQRKQMCSWDNVIALYKAEALKAIPFESITYGEDGVWAKQALLRGKAIVYNSAARIYHYHNESPDFVFRLFFTTSYFQYKQFGFVPIRPHLSLKRKLQILKIIAKSNPGGIRRLVLWYKYNTKNYKAAANSHSLFINTLKQGEEALDKKHNEVCKKAPTPSKVK
jgi:rhamnosyltransferase